MDVYYGVSAEQADVLSKRGLQSVTITYHPKDEPQKAEAHDVAARRRRAVVRTIEGAGGAAPRGPMSYGFGTRVVSGTSGASGTAGTSGRSGTCGAGDSGSCFPGSGGISGPFGGTAGISGTSGGSDRSACSTISVPATARATSRA
jgi:hypothetical protein